MKNLIKLSLALVCSVSTVTAEWWYAEHYPWVWSTETQEWMLSSAPGLALFSTESDTIRRVGLDPVDLSLLFGNFTVFTLEEEGISFGSNFSYPLISVDFGEEAEVPVWQGSFRVTVVPEAGMLVLSARKARLQIMPGSEMHVIYAGDVQNEKVEHQFSITFLFDSQTGGSFVLSGTLPNRSPAPFNGLYHSTGRFQSLTITPESDVPSAQFRNASLSRPPQPPFPILDPASLERMRTLLNALSFRPVETDPEEPASLVGEHNLGFLLTIDGSAYFLPVDTIYKVEGGVRFVSDDESVLEIREIIVEAGVAAGLFHRGP